MSNIYYESVWCNDKIRDMIKLFDKNKERQIQEDWEMSNIRRGFEKIEKLFNSDLTYSAIGREVENIMNKYLTGEDY